MKDTGFTPKQLLQIELIVKKCMLDAMTVKKSEIIEIQDRIRLPKDSIRR